MNVHLQAVSFKKYSLLLIYALSIIASISWSMEFYFERLYGDLTRIGYFSEHDFGWQAAQPAIAPELFKDYSLAEADILVIGDSFAISRVWQTRLVADGMKVSTITWEELGTKESLPEHLGELLRSSGFKGHTVIIESIERLFQKRLETMAKAARPFTKHDVIINSAYPLFPYTQRQRFSAEKLNGADWGVKALYNSIKLSLNLPEKYLKSDAVQAVKFDGCALFSHRLCDYAIFVDGDFKKHSFNAQENVRLVNKNLKSLGIQPIWLIVPDKATVYLGYGVLGQYPYQNIWQSLAQYPDELIAPDVATAFIAQSRTVKDFYMPNDTHISTTGHLYLGELVLDVLHKLQPHSPQP